jgi:NADH-quinone oxidoreductase subunit C
MSDLTQAISQRHPGAVLEVVESRGETTAVVEPARAKALLKFLKEERGFNYLVDVSSAHWPEEGRIDVVYLVRNLKTREQIRIRAALPVEEPAIESVADVWRTADWLEREVYDLMGITFLGHPDLRRILMPEEFEGHPLRKEYPMEGDDEWRNYLPVSEAGHDDREP